MVGMALCSLEEVKIFLGFGEEDDSKDTVIEFLIPAAQSFIEEYCKRTFGEIDEEGQITEYRHGGVNRVLLKSYPIAMEPAPEVYEDCSRVFGEDTLVDPGDYHIDYDSGIIFFDYEVEKGWGAIKIVYAPTIGEEEEDIVAPLALKQACIELVVWKMRRGSAGDIGVVSRGMPGGTSVTFTAEGIPPEIREALDLFIA